MFLRKLFKVGNKSRWLVLELLIVFVGVYLAFLFQSYGEDRKEERERQRIFVALKTELEFFRVIMPGRAGYSKGVYDELKEVHDNGKYRDFSGWRFLEPQYAYQVVQYSINHQNSDLIDFATFQRLQILYANIKRLEQAERLMMQMAHRYKLITSEMPEKDPLTISMKAENFQNFKRLISYLKHRAEDQLLVSRQAADCLELINESMDQDKRKEVETGLILRRIDKDAALEDVLKEVSKIFPNFTEEEIGQIYKELQGSN